MESHSCFGWFGITSGDLRKSPSQPCDHYYKFLICAAMRTFDFLFICLRLAFCLRTTLWKVPQYKFGNRAIRCNTFSNRINFFINRSSFFYVSYFMLLTELVLKNKCSWENPFLSLQTLMFPTLIIFQILYSREIIWFCLHLPMSHGRMVACLQEKKLILVNVAVAVIYFTTVAFPQQNNLMSQCRFKNK